MKKNSKKNSPEDKYILSSKINLAARYLLNIAIKSEPLNKTIDNLSTNDSYTEPQICIKYSNTLTLISEQYKINLQLFKRLNFLLSKSEEKNHEQKTYTESYSITAKFVTTHDNIIFASQVECIKLSATENKNPYRVSEIKTLPAEKEGIGGASYKNIKYQCWEYIDNNILKAVLKGNLSKPLEYDECISCSQIIAMLLCETSRNPVSYITAPMVLDLIQYWITNYKNLIPKIEKLFKLQYSIDIVSRDEYKGEFVPSFINLWGGKTSLLDKYHKTQNKYKENDSIAYSFFKVFYHKAKLDDLYIIEDKSKIVSVFINNLFPMVMEGAVSVSRHITNLLNDNVDGDKVAIKHYYDLGTPRTGEKLVDFIKQEKILVTLWSQCYQGVSLNELTREWLGIELGGDFGLLSGDLLSIDEIPF